MHTFEFHSGPVHHVAWAPFSESLFISGSADHRAVIWDLSVIGDEQAVDEVEDGPSEVRFVHGGHMDAVVRCQWGGATLPWLVTTVGGIGRIEYLRNDKTRI